MLVHNEEVKGTGVDHQTRCAHYHKDIDIIAIKFKCCGEWFPCFQCHAENASHEPARLGKKRARDKSDPLRQLRASINDCRIYELRFDLSELRRRLQSRLRSALRFIF